MWCGERNRNRPLFIFPSHFCISLLGKWLKHQLSFIDDLTALNIWFFKVSSRPSEGNVQLWKQNNIKTVLQVNQIWCLQEVTTHLCAPQFFHGQTCCQPAIRHKQLYSRFTVTCTFGQVLLPIPKFESLQFAIAKELGKNKQRHRLRVNSIIWWRNQTCIIDKFIKQSKKKQKFSDRPVFLLWKSVRNSATASINFYTILMNFLFGSYKSISQSNSWHVKTLSLKCSTADLENVGQT